MMAYSTGRVNEDGSSVTQKPGDGETSQQRSLLKSVLDKPSVSLLDRISFHDRLHKQSKCDLETPASIIANVNIKQLLTPAAFDCLSTQYQNELIKLLPEADRITLDDSATPLAMTVNALSNEFFAKSCVEYRDRLRNGEFCTPAASSRTDIDVVVWECDAEVLREQQPRSDIPKAGEAFICTSKRRHALSRQSKSTKKHSTVADKKVVTAKLKKPVSSTPSNSKSLLKSSRSIAVPVKPLSPSAALAQKAVSKAKAVSNLKTREKEKESVTTQPQVAGVKRSLPEPLPPQQNNQSIIKPELPHSSPNTKQLQVITKFQKVTESGYSGTTVTKVVPIVVRNPHGQVVTTLANCNPLLTQMIRNPVIAQTTTSIPKPLIKREKQSLLPTILRRNNQVIVTLRSNPNIVSNTNGVNKAVTEVISKVKTSSEQLQRITNGSNRAPPVIVTVNGSNGTVTSKLISKTVNIERSKQICESSKHIAPTLNLERSYQICKQVLGKTEGATIVLVGPNGKKKIISKPVRNRLVDPAGSSHNSYCSSDIHIYRNKHRGKSTLTLSGHVFLAMKKDEDGYAAKAYKRKTAFKQKLKKKLSKVASKKILAAASVSKPSQVTGTTHSTDSMNANTTVSAASSLTTVTDTKHATQPVLSVTESKTNFIGGVASLLDSCMCSKRALIICRKCGAFCHSECTSADHCLACSAKER